MLKYRFLIFILFVGLHVLLSCSKKKCENDVYPLIQAYCPDGPNSCTGNLITVEGFLDDINIYDNKFFLYSDIDRTSSNDHCLNHSLIEVCYPATDLSAIFLKSGNSYRPDFKVKVVVQNARIKVFNRDDPGKDDGNYLQVDSIEQIGFYRIENNGALTHLIP